MRVLMLGWEFPPFISGGLGTACHGLTEALRRQHARVLFVLPRAIDSAVKEGPDSNIDEPAPEPAADLRLAPIPSELNNPYPNSAAESQHANTTNAVRQPRAAQPRQRQRRRVDRSSVRVVGVGSEDGYDGDLVRKIRDFTDRCLTLARRELFDVIHAHDWMTFPAAEGIARLSGRPMVVHVHATEFDRSGNGGNGAIFDIEHRGLHAATAVITVSHRTREMIVAHYGVDPEKVQVVHNGIEFDRTAAAGLAGRSGRKTVLFLGRVTMQKGPEYFVRAAARVAERVGGVRFVIAGNGDLTPRITELVQQLGMEDRVEFAGFLRGEEVEAAYRRADVYVMPSVSEPFGLTALEAVRCGVPVVLSKTSGVAEVLRGGALKVDFWDTERMAKMILAVLEQPNLAEGLRQRGMAEIRSLTWDAAADRCIRLYNELTAQMPETDGLRPEPETPQVLGEVCATV